MRLNQNKGEVGNAEKAMLGKVQGLDLEEEWNNEEPIVSKDRLAALVDAQQAKEKLREEKL